MGFLERWAEAMDAQSQNKELVKLRLKLLEEQAAKERDLANQTEQLRNVQGIDPQRQIQERISTAPGKLSQEQIGEIIAGAYRPITQGLPGTLQVPPAQMTPKETNEFVERAQLGPQERERQKAQGLLESLQKITGNIEPKGSLFERAFPGTGVVKAADKYPGLEDDLEAEASRLGLKGAEKFRWKQQNRAEAAGQITGKRSGAAAVGKHEAQETFELDEKAAFWIDPNTGERANAADTLKGVREKGFVPITQSGISSSATAKAALAQLEEYKELAPRLLVKGSGDTAKDIVRIKTNKARLFAKRQAGDPDAKRLEALFGAIATLARATGDTANVAVAERMFLKNFVFTEDDTLESATAKVDQAERILRAVVKGYGIPLPKDTDAISLEDYLRKHEGK